MNEALFSLGFAILLAHELDAVHKHEWRLLFVLRGLPDDTARRVFILAHIPLVAVLLWLLSHSSDSLRVGSQIGLSVFAILHAGLHFTFEGRPDYEFTPPVSRLLIYGAPVPALAHLGLLFFFR